MLISYYTINRKQMQRCQRCHITNFFLINWKQNASRCKDADLWTLAIQQVVLVTCSDNDMSVSITLGKTVSRAELFLQVQLHIYRFTSEPRARKLLVGAVSGVRYLIKTLLYIDHPTAISFSYFFLFLFFALFCIYEKIYIHITYTLHHPNPDNLIHKLWTLLFINLNMLTNYE